MKEGPADRFLWSRVIGDSSRRYMSVRRHILAALLIGFGLNLGVSARAAEGVPFSGSRPTVPRSDRLSEVVEPAFRDVVTRVLNKPTITASGSNGDVACTAEQYAWMLDHPDRVALAWKRLHVPCVDIASTGEGKFVWTDENGSEVVWQTVGRLKDGLVWYATGKVKPSGVLPTVPVKAVAVITRRESTNAKGEKVLQPVAQVFLLTESRGASLILRMLGPTAPKLAEQGAEQLLFFFNGVGNHISRNPEQIDQLLAPAKTSGGR